MKYKQITFDGRSYKYHVGRSNIEVRHNDDGPNFKLILPRPDVQKRWGVAHPCMDIEDARFLKVYYSAEEAQQAYESFRESASGPFRAEVEVFPLPPKTFSITPGWIRQQIEQHLLTSTR